METKGTLTCCVPFAFISPLVVVLKSHSSVSQLIRGNVIDVTELKRTREHEQERRLELMQQSKPASIGLYPGSESK
jgi:hypothetical protein